MDMSENLYLAQWSISLKNTYSANMYLQKVFLNFTAIESYGMKYIESI